MHILINNKKLIYNNYRIKCAVGKRGIGVKKKEGDFITPKGLYKINYILYRKDKIKILRTKKKKIAISPKMIWCDDPASRHYNKLVKFTINSKFERLFRKDNIYDIIFVLNYNMNPIVKKKGSAIFIHVAKKNYSSTQGCIAIKKKNLIKLAEQLKKNTKVRII
jgi:L,D-peptidoglycan transpeptidase YkuD (ErfK/YbiS/YcfS/YnhG family)